MREKLAGHINHALDVYTPIVGATAVTELAAKLVTAFALRRKSVGA